MDIDNYLIWVNQQSYVSDCDRSHGNIERQTTVFPPKTFVFRFQDEAKELF